MRGSFVVVLVAVTSACGRGATPAESASTTTSMAMPSARPAAAPSAQPTPGAGTDSAAVASLEADAQHVAEAWLAEVDAGKYADSWTESAAPFRTAVDQSGWVKAMATARAPLGALKSRALRSAHYSTSLPGAPDAQYVVVQYDTAFEKKQQAVETVTPMREADGYFRVSGYFIK